MPGWHDLLGSYNEHATINPGNVWLIKELVKSLQAVSSHYDAPVIVYASAFLQKPGNNPDISIRSEDINGFMNALIGMPADKGLVLILHTPGGDINAVESIVEYLHSKFQPINVIVPFLAMSGGSMISLASDTIVLGKQSQLGPVDPQILFNNQYHSARALQEGLQQAKKEITDDIKSAHFWAHILQQTTLSLILETEKSLAYSKGLVTKWLAKRMLKDIKCKEERIQKAKDIAAFFNAEKTSTHGQIHVHGQRVGGDKLKELGLNVEFLEDKQKLQDDVLTAYHIMTLFFEHGNAIKFIGNDSGKMWIKPDT